MTTPADELRIAAAKLRTLAVVATPGPWKQTGIGDFGWTVSSPSSALVDTVDSEEGRADADYIAAMHPGVGLALADLLAAVANDPDDPSLNEPGSARHGGCDRTTCPAAAALAVARAITGGQQ